MSFKTTLLAATAVVSLALPAFADGMMMVNDSYARTSHKGGKSGAAFIVIENHTGEDDRLVNATAGVSKRVELHTHIESDDGIMQMVHVEEGFPVKAGESITMQRGGQHVMFMGITKPFLQGEMIDVTLTFEKAGDVVVQVPVDLERKPMHGKMKHGDHNHGNMKKDGDS